MQYRAKKQRVNDKFWAGVPLDSSTELRELYAEIMCWLIYYQA
nr:hypothetical protein [Mycoplasmopsis bovis]